MISNEMKEICRKQFKRAKEVFIGKTLDEAECIIRNYDDRVDFIRRESNGNREYIDFNWFDMCLTVVSIDNKPIERFGANNEVYDNDGNFIGLYEE